MVLMGEVVTWGGGGGVYIWDIQQLPICNDIARLMWFITLFISFFGGFHLSLDKITRNKIRFVKGKSDWTVPIERENTLFLLYN